MMLNSRLEVPASLAQYFSVVACFTKQSTGASCLICVQRQDEGGAFGVGVTDVEVEDVDVVRAHQGRYFGEDAGTVLDRDGHVHVRAGLLDEDAAEGVVRLTRLQK